jgi:hypothetical protein
MKLKRESRAGKKSCQTLPDERKVLEIIGEKKHLEM